jgi:putative redox protein
MAKISTYHQGDMLFSTQLGKHNVLIDVPPSMGGSDRGPTPPEFFVASLGSCVAALVANYCNNAGIDTEGLAVDVTFDKVEDPARLSNVQVLIHLPNGDVNGREKAILRVAERCPVHETICTMDTVKISLNGTSN